jgi:hypothetical protein
MNKARRSSSKGKANQEDGSSPDSFGQADGEDDIPLSAVSAPPESPVLRRPSPVRRANTGDTSESSTPIEGDVDAFTRHSESFSRTRSLSFRVADVIPQDIRSHLQYAKENLTALYYNLPVDGTNFVETGLLENALKFEPLLYAVACFAAYQQTLKRPDGDVKHFLNYHTKSIKLLHDSLKNSQKHTNLTILTILQLATIDVSIHTSYSRIH